MGVLDDLFKRRREVCNGRIETAAGNWVFEPTVKQREDCNHVREDATGRTMYLVKQRGAWCLNPDVCEGVYPKSTSSGCWFVPWAHCRKCRHYRKGGTDGLRFPHCDWQRLRRGGDKGAAKETLGVMRDAVSFADEVMGR